MIDHIGIGVVDLEASAAFYVKALAPLGYVQGMTFPRFIGFAQDGKPNFWIEQLEDGSTQPPRMHVTFVAKDRATVDAFYEAALAAGGQDNGAPGVREIYHPNYYGAFVISPSGHNVEAVCHAPPA